ncbi:hypothetical protein G9444_3842 [Rhodococcus erythropolis]|uniref:Uncharacterized protein n=1 Tax=Rhodococcus erythropolis TaxID=1833 RepID=A0A6G9CWK0_RHOER|nr:hypothetical protein G9444_3842 [Rhodococcus erythropolis]
MAAALRHGFEGIRDLRRGVGQFRCHRRRILVVVPLGLSCCVLIPVLESRIVEFEHLFQPHLEDPEHVAYVGGILQR